MRRSRLRCTAKTFARFTAARRVCEAFKTLVALLSLVADGVEVQLTSDLPDLGAGPLLVLGEPVRQQPLVFRFVGHLPVDHTSASMRP